MAATTVEGGHGSPWVFSAFGGGSGGARVGAWQGASCRVYKPDVRGFCEGSVLRRCGPVVSVPTPAPNASSACIEADLDTEMLFAAADGVASVVGVNSGSSFLGYAIEWFAQENDTAPDIVTV